MGRWEAETNRSSEAHGPASLAYSGEQEMLSQGTWKARTDSGGCPPSSTCMYTVVIVLDCQLDYIWNELQSRNGGHTWERLFLLGFKRINLNPLLVQTFEVGRRPPLIWILRWEGAPLIWVTPSAGRRYIRTWRKDAFPRCLLDLILLANPFLH